MKEQEGDDHKKEHCASELEFTEDERTELRDAENPNGRLAMDAITGMVFQEGVGGGAEAGTRLPSAAVAPSELGKARCALPDGAEKPRQERREERRESVAGGAENGGDRGIEERDLSAPIVSDVSEPHLSDEGERGYDEF